jgi:class 3 adenylate cyclase
VLIVDHSAHHVIRALRGIVGSLRGSHFPQCELRFGLDWGQVGSVPDAAGDPIPSAGLPLRRAARLEAMARPGSVLMTDIASRALTESGESFEISEVTATWPGGPRRRARGWDIGKRPGSEKDLVLQQLFTLEL